MNQKISEKPLPIRRVIRQLYNNYKHQNTGILGIGEEKFNEFFNYSLQKLNFKDEPYDIDHIICLDFFKKIGIPQSAFFYINLHPMIPWQNKQKSKRITIENILMLRANYVRSVELGIAKPEDEYYIHYLFQLLLYYQVISYP